MHNPVHRKRSSEANSPDAFGATQSPPPLAPRAPKFDLPSRTDDPERHSLSTTIGPNGVTCLHHDPHPIDHLHISHRYGFNLHAIAKCPRCFVAGGHRLDRKTAIEVHRKVEPVYTGIHDIPFRRLDFDQLQLSDFRFVSAQ
jgi:hypothetical protein